MFTFNFDSSKKLLIKILFQYYNKDEYLDSIYEVINNIHANSDNKRVDSDDIANNKIL